MRVVTLGRRTTLSLGAAVAVALFSGGSALALHASDTSQQSRVASAADPTDTATQTADPSGTETADPSETETADPSETETADPSETETADPSETETADPSGTADPTGTATQGVHGACVSAVARDKGTTGAAHGHAVSMAAHSCPKGSEPTASATTGTASTRSSRTKPGTSTKASRVKASHSSAKAHRSGKASTRRSGHRRHPGR